MSLSPPHPSTLLSGSTMLCSQPQPQLPNRQQKLADFDTSVKCPEGQQLPSLLLWSAPSVFGGCGGWWGATAPSDVPWEHNYPEPRHQIVTRDNQNYSQGLFFTASAFKTPTSMHFRPSRLSYETIWLDGSVVMVLYLTQTLELWTFFQHFSDGVHHTILPIICSNFLRIQRSCMLSVLWGTQASNVPMMLTHCICFSSHGPTEAPGRIFSTTSPSGTSLWWVFLHGRSKHMFSH